MPALKLDDVTLVTNGRSNSATNHPSKASDRLNGANRTKKPSMYDAEFTDHVIAATGPDAHPRLAQIMPSLLRHLHDFAREVNLTVAEWTAAVDFVRPVPHPL